MKLGYEKTEEMVVKANEHSTSIIENLFRQAVKDFKDADSESFKVQITIECTKMPDDRLAISAKGTTSVELKHKDSTEPETIDLVPNLLDYAAKRGKKGGEA